MKRWKLAMIAGALWHWLAKLPIPWPHSQWLRHPTFRETMRRARDIWKI